METTAASKVYPVNVKEQSQMETTDTISDSAMGVWRDLTSVTPV